MRTLLLLLAACGGSADKGPGPAAPSTDSADGTNGEDAGGDSAGGEDGSTDTDTPDTGGPAPIPGYCRSLDPDWASHYTDPVDQQLAALIAAAGLEGDPALYIGADGQCWRRPLPSITDPMAQLGRALFFSKDLSGDRDVACASCHHPLLGGGDALSLSIGPAADPDAMGADRVRGLTDASTIFVPRNAPTTFNIAFWDVDLFWDGRVESLEPETSVNGSGTLIATPDSVNPTTPAAEVGQNLPDAQAWFPVTEAHEMAGSWATLYPSRDAIRDALGARLAADPAWVAAFDAACAGSPLPDSFAAACALPDGADRDAALASFPHAAYAIGEYERSQVFTASPWQRYVQGDPSALTTGEKKGALLFYQSVADGGQNCVACHKGDLFTDEDYHAIGTPQIGPGKLDGVDLGRGGLEGEEGLIYRFRTPTLLNVEVTAPYSHAGAYATLAKAIGHYDNPNGRLLEYFGEGNKSDLNTRPWCAMTEFAQIPGCADLYTIDHTLGGRVADYLDPELDGIKTLENDATVYLSAFLRTLTDPRVKDPAALADWIDPASTLRVSETSSEWATVCDTMIERAADMNLRTKGLRWMVTGEIADGGDVNTRQVLEDTFGVHYWELFDTAFTANSGVDGSSKQLAIAVLEVLSADQRALLLAAYPALTARGNHAAILALREQIFAQMNAARGGATLDRDLLRSRMAEAAALEAADLADTAALYAQMAALAPAGELARLQAIQMGDLSSLPAGVYTAGVSTLTQSAAIEAEARAARRGGTLPWDDFVAGYLTARTGWDCRYSFLSRQLDADRRANFFGFNVWASEYLFDLNTGKVGSGDFELELSNYIGAKEASLGLSDTFTNTLAQTLEARQRYDAGRAALVEALTTGADPAAVAAANAQVAAADADLLLAELDYRLAFWAALQAAGDTDLTAYVACIEDPATQAMKNHGGFEALGGGSCAP